MSRKKGLKGKGNSRSPKASPCREKSGKGLCAAAPSSAVVYPSRPAISNSGEFYDVAFKVRLPTAVVLKLFHVEDPQIDTYQPVDPQLERYDGDAHIREDYYSYNSDVQTFSF